MLRKHQAIIDCRENCLRIHDAVVPFLQEKDIPKEFLELQSPQASPQENASAPENTTTSQPSTGIDNPRMASQGQPPSEEKLERIMELGFTRSEALQALAQTQGDEEAAAALLSNAKYGF